MPVSRFHLLLLVVAPAMAAGAFVPYETEPVLGSTAFAQPALLSGPGFQVDPHVEIRGYMAHFTIDTPIGPMQAESVEILTERIAEMPALEALEAVTHSQAFLGAANESVERSASGIGQVLRRPIDTLLGIPAGVARYFTQRLGKVGRQAQSLSDKAAHRLGTEGRPYPRAKGPMTEARAIDREEAERHGSGASKSWARSATGEAERELKRQIKYGQVRRELARRLGIDPYTSNPYLRERLERLAWAGSAGRMAASTAIGAIGGYAGLVVDRGSQLNDIVWKLDPDSVRERNGRRLQRHCRDELLMRQFLRRGVYTPTLQTAVVDSLDSLKPASGCDALLELAMTAQSELEARHVLNTLRLTAAHLGSRAHGGHLLPVGAGLAYRSADGELVLALPVDYLSWTEDIGLFFEREDFRVSRKSVLVSGVATMRSQQELTDRGWNIVADIRPSQRDGLSLSGSAR